MFYGGFGELSGGILDEGVALGERDSMIHRQLHV
jgi:hypothetical protein|tara:strand:- start:342 stop:443 length:102 start_codon:yes stop_codon:yes gene_type:complete